MAPMAAKAPMDKDKMKAVADQVFGDMAGAMTAGLCYVGCTTGLFDAMAGAGPNMGSHPMAR